MSAAAPEMGEERTPWVTSGDESYIRLTSRHRETRGEAAEFDNRGLGPWTVPPDFKVALSTYGLRSFLEGRLKSVREVVRVKVAERETRRGAKALHVWTSLTQDDRATRFKVYEIEQELVDHFPEVLFEFHSHLARESAPDGDTIVYEPSA